MLPANKSPRHSISWDRKIVSLYKPLLSRRAVDKTLKCTTRADQSRPGSNGNEEVFHT